MNHSGNPSCSQAPLSMATDTSACVATVASTLLNNGAMMPLVGYGLYQIPAAESEAATREAIALGYRHLDSASFYANEEGVGQAIARCGVPREELFVATKVWTDCIGLGSEAVKASVRKSAELLQVCFHDSTTLSWVDGARRFFQAGSNVCFIPTFYLFGGGCRAYFCCTRSTIWI